MSVTSTVPVLLEPDAQVFADAVATPPLVTELGSIKGREVVPRHLTPPSGGRLSKRPAATERKERA